MNNDIKCGWLKDLKESSVASILASEEGASELAEWLEHAVQCPGCCEGLESLPERTLNELFGSDSVESVEDDDASAAAEAVTNVLLPTLSRQVRAQGEQLIDEFGPYSIYASCEAVNSLFRREAVRSKWGSLVWHVDGDVSYEGRIEFKRRDVAAEIESISGLVKPSDAGELAVGATFCDWLREAARDQRRLLTRFESQSSRDDVILRYLQQRDAVVDPARRWIPRYEEVPASFPGIFSE